MRFIEGLAELLFPTRCAGCEMPGDVLCAACKDALPRIDRIGACPRCGAPWGYLVCTECWNQEWTFEAALALGEFEPPLARAVVLHKDAGERRLASVLGTMLAEQIAAAWPLWAESVAYVPSTRAAIRRRGFDHGRAIAASLASALDVPLLDALERTSARDQRALSRADRAINAAGTFSASGDIPARVLLCDDVFTTGATLEAASMALRDAGAKAVRAVAVARVW